MRQSRRLGLTLTRVDALITKSALLSYRWLMSCSPSSQITILKVSWRVPNPFPHLPTLRQCKAPLDLDYLPRSSLPSAGRRRGITEKDGYVPFPSRSYHLYSVSWSQETSFPLRRLLTFAKDGTMRLFPSSKISPYNGSRSQFLVVVKGMAWKWPVYAAAHAVHGGICNASA